MTENPDALDPLYIAIPEHEVQLVQIALNAIRIQIKSPIDIAHFVDGFMELRSFRFDLKWKAYRAVAMSGEQVAERLLGNYKRMGVFIKDSLQGQRQLPQLEAIASIHELIHIVDTHNIVGNPEVNSVMFIDDVAKSRGLVWNSTSNEYQRIDQ